MKIFVSIAVLAFNNFILDKARTALVSSKASKRKTSAAWKVF